MHAVFDSVGKDTFDASLASLRRRGTSSCSARRRARSRRVDPQRLNAGGSLFLTRPTLGDHVATRDELDLARRRAVRRRPRRRRSTCAIGATFPLADAADAHRALEARATTGKVLLLP